MQRVEAEAREERDREREAQRVQQEAQAEARAQADLEAIPWVKRNWDELQTLCAAEGINNNGLLTLVQRSSSKDSPLGYLKAMIRNGANPGGQLVSVGERMWQE